MKKKETIETILKLLGEETKRIKKRKKKKHSLVAMPILTRPMGSMFYMDAGVSMAESLIAENKDLISVYRGEGGGGEGGSWNGEGIYFSDNKFEAALYGHVKSYIIKITNPFRLNDIVDSSVQGSGLVRLFAETDGLKNEQFHGLTFKQINEIILKLENEIDINNIEIYDGSKDAFKNISYNYKGKNYNIYNRTKAEYDNLEYIKSIFISYILSEQYNIEGLPIRIKDAINPSNFSAILKRNGYDGIIADNSTVPTGYEYVVFDKSQIKEINQSTQSLNEGLAMKPITKRFDHLKWQLNDFQKQFLDDFINIPNEALKNEDLEYASKRTGIPVLSIKSIRNTYGTPEIGYSKPDVVKGSVFDAAHKGPTAKEMGLYGKDLPKEINGKLFSMNPEPSFRGKTPGETIYKAKNIGLHKNSERELPNFMYEWLLYFIEGSEKHKITESKLMNELNSTKFDKYKFILFSFDIILKESKAHPYDLASNINLFELKEFYENIKKFNNTFGTNFVVLNQFTGEDGLVKVVLENAQTTDGDKVYNRKFLDMSMTDEERMRIFNVTKSIYD